MSRISWRVLAIAVPVVLIGGIELLADWVLDPYLHFPYDTLVVTAAVLAVATVLVLIVSRRIDLLDVMLTSRTRELEARTARARELHQISVSVAGTRDLRQILDTVADSARRLLGADVAFVLWPRQSAGSPVAAQSGPPSALAPDDPPDGAEPAEYLSAAYRGSVLAAPLRRAGETVGALVVANTRERSHSVDDLETLSSLANQLALAIENVRLEGQLRELAVRGERERIAREMHDNLAQVLSYVNTKSQAVGELLATGRTALATTQLDELAAAARSLYVDVREAILGLTTPVSPELGLLGALRSYAERYADASKIAAQVVAGPGAEGVELAPEVEAQVFRIVQEALTNVRKHAGAHRAVIGVEVTGHRLDVSVTDDGRGFDPEARATEEGARRAPFWSGYGLRAMRERAATIGAVLTVESRQDTGTAVRLVVPLGAPVSAEVG
jgi:two-component system nitrate/nitrite sensor histidine kinase NarX